jgi:hypothetical protein
MPIQSSFPKVADQVISYNKNVIDILTKINKITTSTDSSVNIQLYDESGILRSFSLPTINALKADIERLNNNINSLYNIDTTGSMIQTSPNTFKKVISVDLNKEPISISSIGSISTFKATNNWFFDSMINPMLSIEIDLAGKIEDNVRRIQSRRYIVTFDKDTTGNLTANGQSALNSFNNIYRGNSTISITDFETWHKTTPGVSQGSNPKIDDQIFELEPNELLYQGQYNVIKIQEDRLNRKLWYVLDTLDYVNISTSKIEKLNIGNELIINVAKSTTRYKIIEISTSDIYPKVRLEKVEGMDAIPVGVGTLKIYSPIVSNKKVMISVGYDERNVVFVKAISNDSHILSRDWSAGTGFWTNDLRLSSSTTDNGTTMEQFYVDFVYDYGTVIKDMVNQKTPSVLGGTPVAPTLNVDNFKVTQINKHLTDTPDSNLIKQKHNYQQTLKSEIQQIQQAILDKNKKAKVEKFKSESLKKQALLEIDELSKKRDSKSKLLSSVTQEILDISKNPLSKTAPKFSARGFWTIPDAVIVKGSKSQEIVQFIVQYRYLSKDGKEAPVDTFSVDNTQTTAAFSNWNEYKTAAKKRIFNPATQQYSWEMQDLTNAEMPNINQLDIPIQPNEKIEIRIKSLSEVGWPEAPIESSWSDILTIEFPDELNNVLNENDTIVKEATKEDLKNSMQFELAAKGLDEHLSDTVILNNKSYHHDSSRILSGFKDANGVALDLYEYLKALEDRIKGLEEKIKRAKGELQVTILRNNQEFIVTNGSETTFVIECEDYLSPYKATGVETGRVYYNQINVIKDFVVKLKNISIDSPLGLLSSRNYSNANTDVYNSSAPQVFWVNNKDELITSDSTGQTKTQINNQYIWSVNYDAVTSTKVNKLADNIGNSFNSNNNNSVTNILGSTEFNLGYGESTLLSFIGNNKSILDSAKWIDTKDSVSSTTKLLTTIHPVVQNLENIIETNSDKIYSVTPGDSNAIVIPLNIYFKMNALDNSQTGKEYQYINLNNSKQTVKHIKKVKFLLENESENRAFSFVIKFIINRNKVISTKLGGYEGGFSAPYITRNDLRTS